MSADKNGDPFTTRAAADNAANDKESEIRKLVALWEGPLVEGVTLDQWKLMLAGRRRARGERDPYAGEITLREWAMTKWLPAQDLEDGSWKAYDQHLRLRILPAFGHLPVNALFGREGVQAWEIRLRKRYKPNVVENCRSLFATILGDARDAGMVDVNAATRRRRRGRVSVRRLIQAKSERPWLTPLTMFLLAERTAAQTGRDDDFIMWTTCGWCGLRWGELMGLQRPAYLGDKLVVDVQLSPPNGGPFVLKPPKDGSLRNDDPDFFGAVDLPPFLTQLLDYQIAKNLPADCGCDCGGSKFLFPNKSGGHHLHAAYKDFPWLQAVTGFGPARPPRDGRSIGSPPRPVLLECSSGFPGAPLTPAWPAATGADWEPPVVRGIPRYDLPIIDAEEVDCPRCAARPGSRCRSASGRPTKTHGRRIDAARDSGHVRYRELACWLPLKAGLTPHGLRHSHRVMLDELGTPRVLAYDRFGHTLPGIGGTYSHVSQSMRENLRARLQARWEQTLDERLALAPGSSVPFVDALLTEHHARRRHDRLPIVSRNSLEGAAADARSTSHHASSQRTWSTSRFDLRR
ncbi:zinc finger domain-containing protein [Actinomadura rubrisoli]|uniref:DNA-binding phage zinc finger domain-containing protein n=1 Tax=Actinomadura rubrisoli TaxID=2530368 RepID=A0A4R5BBU3_9ACTN|nr:hypothetical protein [Actinomadura rubrisoli]TDD82210.1 hypothetical protein E1298_23075 [Actinomadura rubrisoli]